MGFDWGIIKRHPWAFGIIGLVVFVVIYLYMKGGSSAAGTSTDTGPTQADLQLAQIQAAQNSQALQASTQLQAAQIQAGVQTQQIAAQQESTDANTQAQLQAILAQTSAQTAVAQANYGAQVQINQQNTQAATQQAQDYMSVIQDQYDQQTAQKQIVASYLSNLTDQQAAVAQAQIQAGTTLGTQALQYQYQTNQNVLSKLTDVGGSQNRTAILLSAQGNVPGSVVAAQGQTASDISGDTLLARIGSAASSTLATLLA